MEVKSRKEKESLIVSVNGRIDAVTAPDFEKSLSALIATGETRLVINLSELEYISSAGLRSILVIAKVLKTKGGKMIFSSLRGTVKDVFKISGFGSIFQIYDTEAEALNQV
jgi:anti-anti-sigma factor